MRFLMPVIFMLGVFYLETSFAQSTCETKSGAGRIFDVQFLSAFQKVEKCWVIKVPAEAKAIIEVSMLNVNGTSYARAELTVGNHLLEANLRSNFVTLGFSDTKIIFRAENRLQSTMLRAHFQLNFKVLSLACDEPDAFHCTETECVPKSKVCNGVKDCSNGADEEECGTTATPTNDTSGIEGLKESRDNALQLLYNLRFRNGGWREDTPKALVAIHLANGTNFNENAYEQLVASHLQLQILAAISSKEPSKQLLGHFINSLVAICVKPKTFHGYNLLELLGTDLEKTYEYERSLGYLAKCVSGEMLSEDEIEQMVHVLGNSTKYDFFKVSDSAYLASMTIGCASRQGNTVDETALDDFLEEIINDQREDGSFHRDVKLTAKFVQILMAFNRTDDIRWSYEMAVKYLMGEMDKSQGLEPILYTLPVLGGRTMADIRCNGKRSKAEDLTKEDVKDFIQLYKELAVENYDNTA